MRATHQRGPLPLLVSEEGTEAGTNNHEAVGLILLPNAALTVAEVKLYRAASLPVLFRDDWRFSLAEDGQDHNAASFLWFAYHSMCLRLKATVARSRWHVDGAELIR